MTAVYEKEICPHCKKELNFKQIDMIEASRNFQDRIKSVKTIKNN